MNSLLAANLSCLEQGISFLRNLPAEMYTRKSAEVFGSTIGGHLRHNLDHYRALVAGLAGGEVNYDARSRSTEVETRPKAAMALMKELVRDLKELADADPDREIRICMDDGGQSVWSRTTLARELQFLLSHTIHHYALVVAIAASLGHDDFPEGFGVAPSTLHYREQTTT